MSRIRSIHPGYWTDEAYVGLSPHARLFIIGIWNECDDMGIFPWSPLGLKMKILPVDNVDAVELLSECCDAGIVCRYEAGGKPYGAVRNFCQYQRPKKPTFVHPQTDEVRKWVNLASRLKRDGSEGVEKRSRTNSGIGRQREEGGGRGEGGGADEPTGSSSSRVSAAPSASTGTDVRSGSRSKIRFEPPAGVSAGQWFAFCKQRRKPLEEHGYALLSGRLRDLAADGYPPGELIDLAIERGWETVFKPKEERNGQRSRSSEAFAAIAAGMHSRASFLPDTSQCGEGK